VFGQIRFDRLLERPNRFEYPPANPLLGDLGEEAFDLIDPRRTRRREVNHKAGVPLQSSVSYDLHDKFDVYRSAGVREYVVWRVYDRTLDWFVLRDGQFVRLVLAADGFYHS